MDFERRHEAWLHVIESKSEGLAQALARPDTCKVCTCLELLKLSLCPEHSHGLGKQDFELLVGRLLGQIGEEERTNMTVELDKHESYLNFSEKLYDRLSLLQRQFTEYERRMQSLESNKEQLKKEMDSGAHSSQFEDLIQIISDLETRVKSYEDSLGEIKARNRDLSDQLKTACSRRDEAQNQARILVASLQNEISALREEQLKIKANCDSLGKQVADSTAQLNLLRERAEDRSAEEELDQAFNKLKRDNSAFLEEQRRSQETCNALLTTIVKKYDELSSSIQLATTQVDKLSIEQRSLREQQEECKTLSRHSSNLLSAADSVFSQHQELKDFQSHINQCMEEMRRDIEVLKAQRGEVRREEAKSEWSHPGSFEFVQSVGRQCWTCCQTTVDNPGCVRKK